jgi:hypothetical protein
MDLLRYGFFIMAAAVFPALVSCGGPTGDATFSNIQSEIFLPKCATGGCHDAATPGNANLDLSNMDISHEMLLGSEGSGRVGRDSTQSPTQKRVNPGDPDDSYLIQKIIEGGDIADGTRMPPPTSMIEFLQDHEIETIRQWINDGAPKL